MKSWLVFFIGIGVSIAGYNQDSVVHRVIFIGDVAGKDADEQKILQHAISNVVAGKTSFIFSDESSYLRGKADSGSKRSMAIQQAWKLQYQPLRAKGAKVYYFPGIHEWNKSPSKEREKFKWVEQYFTRQPDSLVKFIYGRSCPEPVTVDLGDNALIVFFNSEWWLFPQINTDPEKECECRTKLDVLARLDEIRFRNRHKMILLASHHPFQSYGAHDGKYTAEDHLFPLTSINKNLYVPLPGIGSIYCFFRSAFSSANDVKHPLHKDMVKNVDTVFRDFPNLIHIAGHEPGSQLIRSEEMQVISGIGASHLKAKKAKHSLYANNRPGYAVVDILRDNNVQITFYTEKENSITQSFTYQQPFISVAAELALSDSLAKADSTTVRVHPSYNQKGGLHRFLFGENYRKEWAAPTSLPVIRVSEFEGGLVPLIRGGGMQSQSLRLADKQKKEWVIRSVEKSPDALLPDEFRPTFARDWLDDATSAQHPFSALIVPPIANAVNVPHSVPVIGVIAPDKNLGIYERTFANMVALVEEREPLGESDNTAKMKKNLQDDNDNNIDAREFLNARMLDMLLGDWDRHEDQWRWKDMSKGKSENYVGVPRDRDQVFHVTQGLIPKMASREYVLPTLRNFDPKIEDVDWVLFKTRFVNAYPEFQLSREVWKEQAEKFKAAVTDSVLEAALKRLPRSSYELRHDHLYRNLKSRRDRVPEAMDRYYRFIQKIADIQTSDKDEFVQITDAAGGGMNIRISKIDKDGNLSTELMNKTYDPGLTKEIRLFVRNGNDSIVINNKSSGIKLRLIGGDGDKSYNVIESGKKIRLYDRQNNASFYGDAGQLKKTISNDSLNTAFVPVNLYNIWMPIVLLGLNFDDGFLVSAGFRHIRQEGFRKSPYASVHQVQAGYYFSTGAYRLRYTGEWIHALGKADITMRALANAPNNTANFFGLGNETVYDKTGDDKTYYRTRFSTYLVDPAIRFRKNARSSLSIGPSLYVYFFDKDDNKGRFINNVDQVGSYDSATVEKEKWHLGIIAEYTRDSRSNAIFPQWGTYINIRLQAYNAISEYAKSYAQLIPELAIYKGLNARSTIVIAERVGGVIGMGDAAFYQSAYLGGHENLLGFRQYRFAGKHSFYNNFELRIKLADIASYIIPGQFGIRGLWDIGRVWVKGDNSSKWHNGIGGGIYFAPASVIALSFVVAHSGEGLYPYFTMGLRF